MALAAEYPDLIAELSEIHGQMGRYLQSFAHLQSNYSRQRDPSVKNLLCYLFLRQHDLRELQARLARLGLSSLGRAESHVRATLEAVLRALHALDGSPGNPAISIEESELDCSVGNELLRQNTLALLGPAGESRATRVMVTMPSEAAEDPTLIADWLQNGMDVMRINCAHDNDSQWMKMIVNLRAAEKKQGRRCRVCMDLAGPKLRTGPLAPLPGVLKLRPKRDECGQVIAPSKVFLHAAEKPVSKAQTQGLPSLPLLHAKWLTTLQTDAKLYFHDARRARRCLQVVAVTAEGVWCTREHTCYFVAGIEITTAGHSHHNRGDEENSQATHCAVVAKLPDREASIPLRTDDLLVLTRELIPGRARESNSIAPAAIAGTIGCTLPEVFEQVQVGERVMLDDGRFTGCIESIEADSLQVRITQAPPGGSKLKSDKGINLPDTTLRLSALTDKDLRDLTFIARHADMVAYSFANTAQDVQRLQEELGLLTPNGLAMVLKIETKQAFANLPAMLLEAMRGNACGVMIARGDLAVECGFERLAEIQEEILWICEAAHVPVIWATQVLESLAKSGLPSRAEITDAAMGHRAECVMLNKGPHITRALQTLDNILCRMESHQTKKSSMLRELQLAHGLSRVLS